MNFGAESLLIAFAFLLPGFLSSRLIDARTPSMGREQSAFEETAESLLRSIYIHFCIAAFFLAVFQFLVLPRNPSLIRDTMDRGIAGYLSSKPMEFAWFALLWFLLAFLLALVFGCKWDPLHIISDKLAKSTGTLTEDPFYLLRQSAYDRRKTENQLAQLWMQVRMGSGSVYQGEFMFGGYRTDGQSRELLLTNVIHYPASNFSNPERFDYVFIDTSNCISIESKVCLPSLSNDN